MNCLHIWGFALMAITWPWSCWWSKSSRYNTALLDRKLLMFQKSLFPAFQGSCRETHILRDHFHICAWPFTGTLPRLPHMTYLCKYHTMTRKKSLFFETHFGHVAFSSMTIHFDILDTRRLFAAHFFPMIYYKLTVNCQK